MFMAHISFALLLLHVYRTAALFALSALGDKQVYRVKKASCGLKKVLLLHGVCLHIPRALVHRVLKNPYCYINGITF